MKKHNKCILSILLISCLFTGCGKAVPNVEEAVQNTGQNQNQSEERGKANGVEEKLVDADLLEKKKENGEKAVVIAGDLKSEKYEQLMNTVEEIAEEREMEVYSMDSTAEKNQKWNKENDVSFEMNVVIMSSGHKVVCGIETEEMYQKDVLVRLVDTIISGLN